MKVLLIGHLLGDFYFQSDEMARRKKSFRCTIKHCLYYCIVMCVVLAMSTGKTIDYICLGVQIGLLHLLVDGVKCIFYKYNKIRESELIVFAIDQLIHIVVLFLFSRLWIMEFDISWFPGISERVLNSMSTVLTVIIAFLLCGKPAAIAVSLVFDLIPKTIEAAKNNEKNSTESKKQEDAKVGAWIGILEREIILILGVLGEYSAIGFVVAAKSLARHSQFDNNPAFAENI